MVFESRLALIPSILYILFLSQIAISGTMVYEIDRPLYVGSRPLGMGNAYVGVADDAEAGFWNPAGLIQHQGIGVFASGKLLDRGENVFDSKCVAYCYRETALFWGNKIALRSKNGDTPDFNYYSMAQKLNSHIAVGVSAKFKRRHPNDYYQFFGYKANYDFGILAKPDSDGSFGMLIQGLNGQKRWIDSITLGFSYKLSEKMLSACDIMIARNHSLSLEPHLGWEHSLKRWLTIRIGISDKKPTAGIGININRIQFDYAVIDGSSFVSTRVWL